MAQPSYIIAIDGPVGSGKTTIAKSVAAKLGFYHLDTGAMYRAIAYAIDKAKLAPENLASFTSYLPKLKLKLEPFQSEFRLFVSDSNVTELIRTTKIASLASKVAAIPEVRQMLVPIQRQAAKQYPIVAEGRDIGTVVFPNATLKIYLTATLEIRAQRRFQELLIIDPSVKIDDVIDQVRQRDYDDTNRQDSPLKRAVDAYLLDSTCLTASEVVDIIVNQFNEKINR